MCGGWAGSGRVPGEPPPAPAAYSCHSADAADTGAVPVTGSQADGAIPELTAATADITAADSDRQRSTAADGGCQRLSPADGGSERLTVSHTRSPVN